MTTNQSRPEEAALKAFGDAGSSVAAGADRSEWHTGYVRVDLRRRWLTDHEVSRRIMEAATCPRGVVVVLEVRAGMPVPLALDYLRRRARCEVASSDAATVGRWVRSLREGVGRWVAP